MNISKYFKVSYSVFAITITLTLILISITLAYFISLQKDDAIMINKSGRQRMLVQNITKQVFYQIIENKEGLRKYSTNNLESSITELEEAQKFLTEKNRGSDQLYRVDSVLKITGSQIQKIRDQINVVTNLSSTLDLRNAAITVSAIEADFLADMEQITFWLQQSSENKNSLATYICYILTAIGLGIILIEFFFFIQPAHKQMKQKNKNLTNANKQLSDFAQITAHNLRAPIGNLIFLSNFYKDAESNEERAELFKKFDAVVTHLDETIHVLLDGLKIKTKSHILTELLYFENKLNHTKAMLSGEILASKAIITSDFSQAPSITYNRVYLDSIMLNLVGNAIKYRHETRVPEIHIHTVNEKDRIKLIVQDNGLGIDLKRQGKKVFGLHQTFHRNKNSRGIGLFMTKNQVQSLGGDIEVQSIPGQGSTFIITFKK